MHDRPYLSFTIQRHAGADTVTVTFPLHMTTAEAREAARMLLAEVTRLEAVDAASTRRPLPEGSTVRDPLAEHKRSTNP